MTNFIKSFFFDEESALIQACLEGMEEDALRLIQAGESKPGHVNKYGTTALILACLKGMKKVAIVLIETGESNPRQIDIERDTALILACKNRMEKVALRLIKTGAVKLHHINKNGYSALFWAKYHNLKSIIKAFDCVELEDQSSNKELECSICTDNSIDAVIIGCGHSFCSDCIHRFGKKCPVCRKRFTKTQKIFIS